MDRKIIQTEDGSNSIYVKSIDENYHSTYGAISESSHVFIKNGFDFPEQDKISILEIGFGTGLNAFLSLQRAILTSKKVQYLAVEKYPLSRVEWNSLNYSQINKEIHPGEFEILHTSAWEKWIRINNYFDFFKICTDLKEFKWDKKFDVIYFDAFSPDVHPDLWSIDVFGNLFKKLNHGGILISYSAKGLVKRNLRSCGFKVKRLEGPIGKRHIIRALKE